MRQERGRPSAGRRRSSGPTATIIPARRSTMTTAAALSRSARSVDDDSRQQRDSQPQTHPGEEGATTMLMNPVNNAGERLARGVRRACAGARSRRRPSPRQPGHARRRARRARHHDAAMARGQSARRQRAARQGRRHAPPAAAAFAMGAHQATMSATPAGVRRPRSTAPGGRRRSMSRSAAQHQA